MVRITVLCAACKKPIEICRCPDDPVDEPVGFAFNRMGEEFMRWLRYWGVIK